MVIAASLAPVAWVGPRRGAGKSSSGPSGASTVARWTQGALLGAVLVYGAWCLTQHSPPFYLLVALLPLVAALPLPGRPRWIGAVSTRAGGVAGYLFGLLAITTLTHAVFFGDDRYHLVVTPALCLLAGAALRPLGPSASRGPAPSPASAR